MNLHTKILAECSSEVKSEYRSWYLDPLKSLWLMELVGFHDLSHILFRELSCLLFR
jgi:hypothetical protein